MKPDFIGEIINSIGISPTAYVSTQMLLVPEGSKTNQLCGKIQLTFGLIVYWILVFLYWTRSQWPQWRINFRKQRERVRKKLEKFSESEREFSDFPFWRWKWERKKFSSHMKLRNEVQRKLIIDKIKFSFPTLANSWPIIFIINLCDYWLRFFSINFEFRFNERTRICVVLN